MQIQAHEKAATHPRSKKRGLLVIAVLPELVEKPRAWFSENEERIRRLATREKWWSTHAHIVSEGKALHPFELSRTLTRLGYEQTSVDHTHEGAGSLTRGSYAMLGGAVLVAPINKECVWRVEFFGSTVERITKLSAESAPYTAQRVPTPEHETRFTPGEYVVHRDHGIGIFKGVREKHDGRYWEIAYAKNDKLFVPITQYKRIERYLAFSPPRVTRLSGGLWEKITKRARDDAYAFARTLMDHYKKRQRTPGFAHAPDGPEMHECIASFPHPPTPDQTQAWEEIRADMDRARPMERILVGDVGFGKTEVALWAAYKAVLSGKQAVLLAPTTVLAWQHYQTFCERLARRGVNIELVSRVVSPRALRETLKRVRNGTADIVIGTHRLLSPDAQCKNLGLLIIDEEQRFGVAHKEKLAMLTRNVDTLMLSATPIPRTLAASLAGVKDLSRLTTPPLGRRDITTVIEPFRWERIAKAIQYEIARGGQVFFLENRIGNIPARLKELSEHLPGARCSVLHGKRSEKDIVTTLETFQNGESDILVTTTIIENGLDLPNANTLVVADATRLGLAQAHQLRGRVGRSHHQAFAYFFHPKEPSEKAERRLAELARHSRIGDGFNIALEDLALRGAGNILGKEQSGHIHAVGMHLYLEMMQDALLELQETSS